MAYNSENIHEVQTSIAQLENRARQLVTASAENRVARNARSVFYASQNLLLGTSTNVPENQTNTELFVADNIPGFNFQEQQRLFKNIVETKPPPQPVYTQPEAFFGIGNPSAGLEAFLANKRAEALRALASEAHQRLANVQRIATEKMIASAAEKRTEELAEILGMQSVQILGGSDKFKSRPSFRNLSSYKEHKIRLFSQIVATTSPAGWGKNFVQISLECANNDPDDPLFIMWSASNAIVSPLFDNDQNNTIECVATSRGVLEEKFLMHIFNCVKGVSGSFEEFCRMPADKLYDTFFSYCNSSNPSMWELIYYAIRTGSYDSAHHIAIKYDAEILAKTLLPLTTLPRKLFNTEQACVIIPDELWGAKLRQDARRWDKNDAYQAAVLLVLCGGRISSASDENLRQFVNNIIERVAFDIEDNIWLRLCLIRYVGDDGLTPGPKIHFLEDLQRLIIDDQQAILTMVNNNPIKFASVLFHVLLPNKAVYVLLEEESTFVDGFHLALLYHVSRNKLFTMYESSLDIGRLVRRYSTLLLEMPNKNEEIMQPSYAILDYFIKSNAIDSLVEFAQHPSVAFRLFGRIDNNLNTVENGLVRGNPTPQFLDAIERVAKKATERGNWELSIQMYVILARYSDVANDVTRAKTALLCSLRTISTAMSRSILSGKHGNIIKIANALHELILNDDHEIPSVEIETMRSLRAMMMIHSFVSVGDEDSALRIVRTIPFIPQTSVDVEAAVRRYHNMVISDYVLAAMPSTVLVIMKILLSLFQKAISKFDRNEIKDFAQALVLWVIRWRYSASKEVIDALTDMQREMMIAK